MSLLNEYLVKVFDIVLPFLPVVVKVFDIVLPFPPVHVAQYGSWAVVVGEVFGFPGSFDDLLLCRRSVEVDAISYL